MRTTQLFLIVFILVVESAFSHDTFRINDEILLLDDLQSADNARRLSYLDKINNVDMALDYYLWVFHGYDAYTLFHTQSWQHEFTERIYWKYKDGLCQALKKKLGTLFSNKDPSLKHPSIWEDLFYLHGTMSTLLFGLDADCFDGDSKFANSLDALMLNYIDYNGSIYSPVEHDGEKRIEMLVDRWTSDITQIRYGVHYRYQWYKHNNYTENMYSYYYRLRLWLAERDESFMKIRRGLSSIVDQSSQDTFDIDGEKISLAFMWLMENETRMSYLNQIEDAERALEYYLWIFREVYDISLKDQSEFTFALYKRYGDSYLEAIEKEITSIMNQKNPKHLSETTIVLWSLNELFYNTETRYKKNKKFADSLERHIVDWLKHSEIDPVVGLGTKAINTIRYGKTSAPYGSVLIRYLEPYYEKLLRHSKIRDFKSIE